eukprot:m.251670 g.251670  ORF g.251670 m.251670 type:complete len:303 (+) comp40338_c0_seq3:519-1427(+)
MRRAISVEKRAAITLWFLASMAEYRTIAYLFGVGKSTVCSIINETCRAIVAALLQEYISFPAGPALQEIVSGFSHMPQCAGAIDGSHIPITPPALNHTDYYNRKGWYSVIIQAVVDHQYRFLDVCIGWPGSVHDARVLANSKLYEMAKAGQILIESAVMMEGSMIPVYLIGDSAYPLLSWLMKPFPRFGDLSDEKKNFNYRLSSARIVVENTFGRLKSRWRRLKKALDVNIDNVPHIVAACCVLNNICEVKGDGFEEEWRRGEEDDQQHQPQNQQLQGDTCTDGPENIRAALVRHFQVAEVK